MIISIDPGVNGGIVILITSEKIVSSKMPSTDGDIKKFIDDAIYIGTCGGNASLPYKRAIIEKVSGFAGEGHPGSAMFEFGESYGFIRGLLTEKGFRIELMRPQDWQRILGLGHKDHARCILKPNCAGYETEKRAVQNLNAKYKREWKNKLKEKAQQLFPEHKITLNTSDAFLILEAARRISF